MSIDYDDISSDHTEAVADLRNALRQMSGDCKDATFPANSVSTIARKARQIAKDATRLAELAGRLDVLTDLLNGAA